MAQAYAIAGKDCNGAVDVVEARKRSRRRNCCDAHAPEKIGSPSIVQGGDDLAGDAAAVLPWRYGEIVVSQEAQGLIPFEGGLPGWRARIGLS